MPSLLPTTLTTPGSQDLDSRRDGTIVRVGRRSGSRWKLASIRERRKSADRLGGWGIPRLGRYQGRSDQGRQDGLLDRSGAHGKRHLVNVTPRQQRRGWIGGLGLRHDDADADAETRPEYQNGMGL